MMAGSWYQSSYNFFEDSRSARMKHTISIYSTKDIESYRKRTHMETPLEQMRQILAQLSLSSRALNMGSDIKHKVRVLSDLRSSFLACS